MRYLEKAKRLLKDESGMSLVVAMTTLLAMTALSALVFYSSVNNTKIQSNLKLGVQADYAAQSGLTVGEQYLKSSSADPTTATQTNATWSVTLPSSTLPNGSSYTVTITHVRKLGTDGTYDAVDNATSSGLPLYRITSTGTAGGSASVMEEVTSVQQPEVLWGNAITACSPLVLKQTAFTDSYDSTHGAYNGTSATNYGGVYAEGNITILNTAHVNGNVLAAYTSSREPGSISYSNGAYSIGNATADGSLTLGSGTTTGTYISSTTGGGNAQSYGAISGTGTIQGAADTAGTISGVTVDGTATHSDSNITQTLVKAPPECKTTDPNIPQIPANVQTANSDKNGVSCSSSHTCSSGCFGTVSDGDDEDDDNYGCTIANNGVMTLTGSNTPASPTVYYWSSLTEGQNAKVVTTGYVRVFVRNQLVMNQNAGFCGNVSSANCTGSSQIAPSPSNVFLYMCGSACGGHSTDDDNEGDGGGSVTMANNSFLYGSLYAPNTTSTEFKQNFQIFGLAVVGSRGEEDDDDEGGNGGVTIANNAAVHYDAALVQPVGSQAGYTMQYRKKCLYGVMSAPNGQYMTGSCNPGN